MGVTDEARRRVESSPAFKKAKILSEARGHMSTAEALVKSTHDELENGNSSGAMDLAVLATMHASIATAKFAQLQAEDYS